MVETSIIPLLGRQKVDYRTFNQQELLALHNTMSLHTYRTSSLNENTRNFEFKQKQRSKAPLSFGVLGPHAAFCGQPQDLRPKTDAITFFLALSLGV